MLMKAKHVLMGMLAVATALVACQREPKAADNPTYNPDDKTVLARLVLNLSTASGSPNTKQTSEAVQSDGNTFRGIQDVHLLTYSVKTKGPKGEYFLYDVQNDLATKDFDLGNMMQEGDANKNKGLRVLQLALPLETNTVLLYGRATRTGNDTDEKLGHVDAAGNALQTPLTNVTFSLKDRMNGKENLFTLYGDLMGRILTGIMNTGLEIHDPKRGYKVPSETAPSDYEDGRYCFWWPADSVASTLSFYYDSEEKIHLPDSSIYVHQETGIKYRLYWGSVIWQEYGDAYGKGTVLAPLAEVMGEAYHNITTLSTKTDSTGNVLRELRAASSGAVLRITQDLYGILSRVIKATPTTGEEMIAQLLAAEILDRASKFFYVDHTTETVYYHSLGTILSGVDALIPERTSGNYAGITDDFFYRDKGDPALTRSSTAQVGFPVNMGMPLGSAIMTFINPHKLNPSNPYAPDYNVVQYLDAIPAYGMGGVNFPVTNYRYPAELMYYTNSNIRTSDVDKKNSDYPEFTAIWWDDTYWSGWKGGNDIKSSTQSVAVAKTINYGTALLATKVGYSASTIHDNNKGLHPTEANNTINVERLSKQFEITGIMIGGVCDQVGWDFIPKTSDFTKMIYDDLSYDIATDSTNYKGGVFIPRYTATANDRFSQDMYTLTFDNYDKTKDPDKQNVVYMALEIKNRTGQDLWGELNMIRRDGTFYLVGALDPTDSVAVSKFYKGTGANRKIDLSRNDMNYPPFDAQGNTINAPRVFMQDYITTVKLNFTPESLSHAYLTMPDLRAGQISLGLSVDVSWEKGYEFEVDLGGGTN